MKHEHILILILFCLLFFLIGSGIYRSIKAKQPEQPATLNMELVCVTPHGHQVWKYWDVDHWDHVLTRHSDGYPIAMSSNCK